MNLKNILNRLDEREMDRKDFLKYSGLVVIGLVGLKGFINLLSPDSQPSEKTVARTFGNGRYGR